MYKFYFTVLIVILIGCQQETRESVREVPHEIKVNSADADYFSLLLDSSGLQKKNLFLVFAFKGCGICKIFEKYHNDSIVKGILSKYIIVKEIDINLTPGGKELYKTYGKMGFPSWTILDSTRTVIMDSEDSKGNIGYPSSARDREYYIKAIRAASALTLEEGGILINKLREYRPGKDE
jgi:hypothetical protein